MRISTIIMIAVAAVFGLLAVFVAQSWLNSQAEARLRSIDTNKHPPIAAETVVVAARPLRFGEELTAGMLREAPWPDGALPPGAVTKISEMLSRGKRIVLTAIEANEPVLTTKITGPGQRATLSALVSPGMKAVTIRVNAIDGVGGFVLPGDRVDIVLIRPEKENAATLVLLQHVRVLAINQLADERASDPVAPKSVTVEVDTVGGQKLGLAASIGTLSLLLRKAGETTSADAKPVTLRDLVNDPVGGDDRKATTVMVTRGHSKAESYQVPRESTEPPTAPAAAHAAIR